MRKKIYRHSRPHSLFIAQQEVFFELGEPVALHRKNDFVNYVLPQKHRQIGDPPHRIPVFKSQALLIRGWRELRFIGQKPAQPDAIIRRPAF